MEGCRCRGRSVEVRVWRDVGVEVRAWRDIGGGTGVKTVLQHGFMCQSDVEEHMGVDIPSILVGNRRMEEGREKGRDKGSTLAWHPLTVLSKVAVKILQSER